MTGNKTTLKIKPSDTPIDWPWGTKGAVTKLKRKRGKNKGTFSMDICTANEYNRVVIYKCFREEQAFKNIKNNMNAIAVPIKNTENRVGYNMSWAFSKLYNSRSSWGPSWNINWRVDITRNAATMCDQFLITATHRKTKETVTNLIEVSQYEWASK